MSYEETKQTVTSLLAERPQLGPERLPTAADDYGRLMPAMLSEVRSLTLSSEKSVGHNRDYRVALLRVASIECAAGAGIERCRTWFHCLASLASWTPPDASGWMNDSEAAIWTSLACHYDASIFTEWPDDPCTETTSDRVVYRLLTQKRVVMKSDRVLFENRFWEDLCLAVEEGQSATAGQAFQSIADWWLAEYRDSETPVYDPEHFSTFEPAPNAALAIALIGRQMQIYFHRPEHQRFYYVALMLAQAQSEIGGVRF